jgi:Mce-associated membrane protein
VVDARSREQVGDSADEQQETPRTSRSNLLLAWALSVLLIASLAGLVVAVVAISKQDTRDDARLAVMRAGRQTALDFTTYKYQTWDADVQRVLNGATGPFKEEFSQASASVKAQVVANKASSAGEVIDAAVVSMDTDSAQVLVVADAAVTNTAIPDGQRRHYRMKLELVREGQVWRTADLEAVG